MNLERMTGEEAVRMVYENHMKNCGPETPYQYSFGVLSCLTRMAYLFDCNDLAEEINKAAYEVLEKGNKP